MLRHVTRRPVTLREKLEDVQGNAFAVEGVTLLAQVQPMSGSTATEQYGLLPSQMRLLLCDPQTVLRMGQGVCVDVPGDQDPDFLLVYVEAWGRHQRAHLRYIPPEERGPSA